MGRREAGGRRGEHCDGSVTDDKKPAVEAATRDLTTDNKQRKSIKREREERREREREREKERLEGCKS